MFFVLLGDVLFCLSFVLKPEIQTKVHKEINVVVGKMRVVSDEDVVKFTMCSAL